MPRQVLPLNERRSTLDLPEGETNLVLMRREGQTIHVDGPCTITAVRCWDGKTSLSIIANASVRILRGELAETDAAKAAG